VLVVACIPGLIMQLPTFPSIPHAIAIDLDGTLLNSRTELTGRTRRALERCLEHGIPVIVATSRPARIFNRIFPQDLARRCSYVLMNGALAVGNPPLSGNYRQALPQELLNGILDCARRLDASVRITIEIDGYEFGTNMPTDAATLWQRNSATPDMVLTIEEASKRQPCKVALGGADVVGLAECLAGEFGDSLSVVTNKLDRPILMVTTPDATKPAALRKLLEPHGISLSEVLAFGDDLPDLEMLQACGTSVAMANAFPEVKAACAYHTAGNDEDGVAQVLEVMLGSTQ